MKIGIILMITGCVLAMGAMWLGAYGLDVCLDRWCSFPSFMSGIFGAIAGVIIFVAGGVIIREEL